MSVQEVEDGSQEMVIKSTEGREIPTWLDKWIRLLEEQARRRRARVQMVLDGSFLKLY